jgi:hypothetical protein
VEYTHFIMVMMVKTLEKVEITPAVAPVEFLPPIFASSGSILVFRCFCGALLEEATGSFVYRF